MAALTSNGQDKLPTHAELGFSTAFDYKGSYVSPLANKGEGLERFSQLSATPDTTLLFAGPARFTSLNGSDTSKLTPIGLVDGVNYQQTPQLQRLFEIGSNRSFFTRGKTMSYITFSKMIADQKNLLLALMQNAYVGSNTTNGTLASPTAGDKEIAFNLDSEYFGHPFGLMMVFKTRGGTTTEGEGKLLAAVYLEYCMFSNYNFNLSAQSPVIMDNISIEFDRTVPVDLQ